MEHHALQDVMSVQITENPGHGFGLLYRTLRAEAPPCGKTRIWRVYCELKLNQPRREKCVSVNINAKLAQKTFGANQGKHLLSHIQMALNRARDRHW